MLIGMDRSQSFHIFLAVGVLVPSFVPVDIQHTHTESVRCTSSLWSQKLSCTTNCGRRSNSSERGSMELQVVLVDGGGVELWFVAAWRLGGVAVVGVLDLHRGASSAAIDAEHPVSLVQYAAIDGTKPSVRTRQGQTVRLIMFDVYAYRSVSQGSQTTVTY